MAEKIVACRYCGEQGIEDSDDPAPGVCPGCLDDLLKDSEDRIANAVTFEDRFSLCKSIGLTDAWATIYAGAYGVANAG